MSKPSQEALRRIEVDFPASEVDRILRLLRDTRLPPDEIFSKSDEAQELDDQRGFKWGITKKQVEELRSFWLSEWRWEDVKAEINSYENYIATVEDVEVHVLSAKSKRKDAIPLLLPHGWPSSFYEWHRVIPRLTDPPSDNDPAFHVVCVSQIGFFLSSSPPRSKWFMKDNARVYDKIMVELLGHKSYVAHGGDWGQMAVACLDYHPACKAIHCSMLPANPTVFSLLFGAPLLLLPERIRDFFGRRAYSDEDRRALSRAKWWFTRGSGYFLLQRTKPSKIGIALNDNPLGLLSWIGEVWLEISGPSDDEQAPSTDGTVPSTVKRTKAELYHDIITTVALYHLSQSFYTSVLPYAQVDFSEQHPIKNKPLGWSIFPYEVASTPVAWARKQYRALNWTREHDRGGHFPGLDCPDLLAQDLRDFFSENYKP